MAVKPAEQEGTKSGEGRKRGWEEGATGTALLEWLSFRSVLGEGEGSRLKRNNSGRFWREGGDGGAAGGPVGRGFSALVALVEWSDGDGGLKDPT